MKICTGNPVEGEDFFGRELEQEQIWRKIESNHILMLAPRRVGKTSLMRRLCDTGKDHGYQVVLCSFAPCDDELHCIERVLAAVTDNATVSKGWLEKLQPHLAKLRGIKLAGVGIEFEGTDRSQWRYIGEGLLQTLSQLEEPIIICVDEVPIFLLKLLKQENGREKAQSFLNWFRDLRQAHSKNVRWILAGSIGLDTVVSRIGLGDTINDLPPFALGAFDQENAEALIMELAKDYDVLLETPAREYIISKIGWPTPYYLQLMMDKLIDQNHPKGTNIDTGMIDQAFEELLKPAYKIHFDYWRQRLSEELGVPDCEHAEELLNAVCRDITGVSYDNLSQILSQKITDTSERKQKLRYLLDVLENDGYIVEVKGRYQFRLEWLREYWLRRVAP